MDRRLIEDIVTQVLEKMEKREKPKKPPLLAIHPASADMEAQLAFLNRYWNVTLVNPADYAAHSALVERAVFLEVDQDLLVKGALGLADSPQSVLFAELMTAGCSVHMVLSKALQWMENAVVGYQHNAYRLHLLQYKKQLEEFGVQFTTIETLRPANNMQPSAHSEHANRYPDKLLTHQKVETWTGKQIIVSADTIITPLARDTAREMGITISILES
ncbi:hypothetical protein [Bacillus piscicola]|uniref:hypothetical protein n=1 Tax=Bacillus piscicola TaxID=1632684 RepID=UPI001F08CBC8|nr:hypothetical protein [Bacillus piscicola]